MKKISKSLWLNKKKLAWIALSVAFSAWMAYEQNQGSLLQYVAALGAAVAMLPGAMTDWQSLV